MELIWTQKTLAGNWKEETEEEKKWKHTVLAWGKWQLLSLLKASPHPPGSFTFPFNMSFLEEKPIFNEFKCQVCLCGNMGFYPFSLFATLWCVRHRRLRLSWKIKPCHVSWSSITENLSQRLLSLHEPRQAPSLLGPRLYWGNDHDLVSCFLWHIENGNNLLHKLQAWWEHDRK